MQKLLLLVTILCVGIASAAQAAPLKVVTSFSILADMVRTVGGGDVQVTSLVGPGADAHSFEPGPANIREITSADLFVINGLGFEGWMDRLTQASGFKGQIVRASDGIAPMTVNGAPDPHAWQSVPDGKLYVVNIRDALMKADPAHAAAYEKRASDYLHDLGELDMWVRMQIAHIPMNKRAAITSHDALGYFGAEYGVVFIAPLGLSTSGDVSAGNMAKLVDEIREKQVRAVFLENMADPRLIKQLVADGGAVIGGTLYSDALSAPDGEAPTYIAIFRHNVTAMVAAMRKN